MAQKRTRRRFTREFKTQAVKRLLEGGRGLSEIATEIGVGTAQLSVRGDNLDGSRDNQDEMTRGPADGRA